MRTKTHQIGAALPASNECRRLLAAALVALLALSGMTSRVKAQSAWNGSVSLNWSDAGNWTPNGIPGAATNVVFNNAVFASDTNVNNVVDTGFTGPIASLTYTNISNNSFENTLIADGVILTVNGPLGAGSSTTANTVGASTTTTISGAGGSLVVNTTTNVYIGWTTATGAGFTGPAYLDMSGLGNFNAGIQRLIIGQGNAGANSYGSGIVYLAKTNVITATGTGTANSGTVVIGDNNNNSGYPSFLYLGLTNSIFAKTIACGLRKQIYTGYPFLGSGIMFNPAFTNENPTAYFRGNDGVSPVGIWSIGDGVAATSTVQTWGACDFTGGSVNALVTTLFLARPAPGATHGFTSVGSLTLSAGLFSVANLTNAMLTSSTGPQTATGTITVNGTAVLSAGNLVMGALNGFTGNALATLNITNATVIAQTITPGGGTSTINMDTGTLTLTNATGTPATPLSALNLNNGTIHLNVVGGVTNIIASAVAANGTNTIDIDSISGMAGGTVTLPLINYTGTDPFAGFALGTIPSGCTGASLVDDTAKQTVDLTVTVAPAPTITSLSPNCGLTNGGTVVTINGSAFVSGLGVKFGTTAALAVNYSSASLITATSPPGALGAVNVTVQNPDGQTAVVPNGFIYFLQPAILPVTLGVTNLNIQFSSATGVVYNLQYATNLISPVNWMNLPDTNGTGGAIGLLVPVDPAQAVKFFRVRAGMP